MAILKFSAALARSQLPYHLAELSACEHLRVVMCLSRSRAPGRAREASLGKPGPCGSPSLSASFQSYRRTSLRRMFITARCRPAGCGVPNRGTEDWPRLLKRRAGSPYTYWDWKGTIYSSFLLSYFAARRSGRRHSTVDNGRLYGRCSIASYPKNRTSTAAF